MANRYQQGIGVPETLGNQPTTWKEPTPTPTKAFSFSPQNTGARRDYGSTPSYVDTVPARWTVAGGNVTARSIARIATTRAQDRAEAINRATAQAQRDVDDQRSAQALGISVAEVRSRRAADAEAQRREDILSRDRAIAMRMGPAGPALGGEPPSEGLPMPSPAMVRTGRPVPTPPSDAPAAPTGTPTLSMPPMPPRTVAPAPWATSEPDVSTAGDPFMEGLRLAPDTPLDVPSHWRNDPDMDVLGMPRPRMTTESTDPEAQAQSIEAFWRNLGGAPNNSRTNTRGQRNR